MPRTLVTGAAGFTARYVAEALMAEGHEVHGLVHFKEELNHRVPGFDQLHLGDLCDLDALRRVTAEIQPDHATSQPWALFAFIWNPATRYLADQVLHTARSTSDGVSLILLADALYCVRMFL